MPFFKKKKSDVKKKSVITRILRVQSLVLVP